MTDGSGNLSQMATENRQLAPVVLFAYNRLRHTRRTIETLQKNELAPESNLIVFSDGPKNESAVPLVRAVRAYLKTIQGFQRVTVVERDRNFGLGNNIIAGVTEVVNRYGRVIVLEDDLVTSPFFLRFMNDALETYAHVPAVCEVTGYSYFEKYITKYDLPEFIFIKGADCLAWGTWKDRWSLFDPDASSLLERIRRQKNGPGAFDLENGYPYTRMLARVARGKLDSWAIRWYASAFLANRYTLYPTSSFALHIGYDLGTNYAASDYDPVSDPLNVPLCDHPVVPYLAEVEETSSGRRAYREFMVRSRGPLMIRVVKRIKRLLKSLGMFKQGAR